MFLILFKSVLFGQKTNLTYTISPQIIPYCGGAAPPSELLEESKKPKPYAQKTLYLYTKGKCIDSLITNDLGAFTVKIKPGVYQLFERWKHFKTGPNGEAASEFNPSCLKAEWSKPDVVIKFKKGKSSIMSNMTSYVLCPWQHPCRLNKEMPPVTRPH